VSHRPHHRQAGFIRLASQEPTIHCKQVQQHIPIVDAVKKHDQDSAYCFACGRAGNECKHEASRRNLGKP